MNPWNVFEKITEKLKAEKEENLPKFGLATFMWLLANLTKEDLEQLQWVDRAFPPEKANEKLREAMQKSGRYEPVTRKKSKMLRLVNAN